MSFRISRLKPTSAISPEIKYDGVYSGRQPGHPHIARHQSNLATVLEDLGEPDEARDLLCRAYHNFLKKFGPLHPKTKIVKGNLDSLRS